MESENKSKSKKKGKFFTEADAINLVTEAFGLGKRVQRNKDYYSLSDPLSDFINDKITNQKNK